MEKLTKRYNNSPLIRGKGIHAVKEKLAEYEDLEEKRIASEVAM